MVTHDEAHPPPLRPHRVIAARVRELRDKRRLTAAQLAERMTEAGVKWDRSVVANLESGRRASVSVEELLALAYVLEVAPVHLIVPVDADGWFAVTPDLSTTNEYARAWIRGSVALPGIDERQFFSEVPADEWNRKADAQLEFERGLRQAGIISGTRVSRNTGKVTHWDRETGSWTESADSDSHGAAPVVAAIVTSALGVLVGRRNDGSPPWTFIAGEVEPGELPEDAAIREVKEETGLEVRAGQVIGERDHPATGRHMIYMAAAPVRGTSVFVGDEAELAEVRWVSLAEADELLPGMFEPVREYLAGELR